MVRLMDQPIIYQTNIYYQGGPPIIKLVILGLVIMLVLMASYTSVLKGRTCLDLSKEDKEGLHTNSYSVTKETHHMLLVKEWVDLVMRNAKDMERLYGVLGLSNGLSEGKEHEFLIKRQIANLTQLIKESNECLPREFLMSMMRLNVVPFELRLNCDSNHNHNTYTIHITLNGNADAEKNCVEYISSPTLDNIKLRLIPSSVSLYRFGWNWNPVYSYDNKGRLLESVRDFHHCLSLSQKMKSPKVICDAFVINLDTSFLNNICK